LPLLFGHEFWRVAEDGAEAGRPQDAVPATARSARQPKEIPQTAPCA
jgi:hypothetical protein